MIKLYRSLLVLAVIILIILGLNISNQGINSLTMESRKPLMGIQTQGSNISVFTMGETHSYGKQEIVRHIIVSTKRVQIYAQAANNYMLRIVRIAKVLLFT